MLNWIWGAFFLIAFAVALGRWLIFGDSGVWQELVQSTFESSRTAFEISIGLTGVMCLWLGVMKLGEEGGAVDLLARAVKPLFRRLFPGVPDGHPAMGSMLMNMAANALNLDNAATPLGLKAMQELQELNPDKTTASNDQILFLVINTSSVTLIPVTIFVYRFQAGAANPTDIFIPLLITTFCATIFGLVITAMIQRIRLLDRVVLAYLGGMTAVVAAMVYHFQRLDQETLARQSAALAGFVILGIITSFLVLALRRRVPVYERFVEGAKGGFEVAVRIIPYLVAMLVAIGLLRASGALDLLLDGIRWAVAGLGMDTRWVDALPTGLMRSLSGQGSRGLMIETMTNYGADSFAGRLASIFLGSSETTFYVLAVYFGSVGIRRTRHALACGLAADAVCVVAAIVVCYMFFG